MPMSMSMVQLPCPCPLFSAFPTVDEKAATEQFDELFLSGAYKDAARLASTTTSEVRMLQAYDLNLLQVRNPPVPFVAL